MFPEDQLYEAIKETLKEEIKQKEQKSKLKPEDDFYKVASTTYRLYDELKRKGFTESQSLELTKCFISEIIKLSKQ